MKSVVGAPSAWWLVVLLMAAALTIGAVACGSDDGGDSGSDSEATAQSSSDGGDGATKNAAAEITGAEERDIETRVNRVQRAILTGDSALICQNLTDAARKAAAKRSSKGTCAHNFDQIAAGRVKGAEFPKVVKVEIDGDKADVTLRQNDGRSFPLEMVKENGEWRLDLLRPGYSEPPKTSAPPTLPQG